MRPERPFWQSLLVICLTTAGWAFTFGVGSQVMTLWMNDAGCSETMIGWHSGIYYLGLTLAALTVPWLIQRRLGQTAAALGMLLSGGALALFPCTELSGVWLCLRIIQGVGAALSLVPLETHVSQASAPEHRARNFGCYAVALTLGGALGIAAGLHFFEAGDVSPFLLGAAPAALAGIALRCWRLQATAAVETQAPVALDLRRHALSYGAAWCQGFLEGGMLTFLPLYLLSLDYEQDDVGILMGATMVAVIVAQLPLASLADRWGRQRMLLACFAVVFVGLLWVPWLGRGAVLLLSLLILGASSGALYPLGLALLGERLPDASLARAYAYFMAIEGLGCVAGPICLGVAIDWLDYPALFLVSLAMVGSVLVLWWTLQRGAKGGVDCNPSGDQRYSKQNSDDQAVA